MKKNRMIYERPVTLYVPMEAECDLNAGTIEEGHGEARGKEYFNETSTEESSWGVRNNSPHSIWDE